MAALNDATIKSALLILWDVCTDLKVDPETALKLDQLRRCIDALDVSPAAVRQSRDLIDANTKEERKAAKT